MDQPCTFPEVFLTLGAPGDNLVIPLSPAPGRPLSFNLNLVPKEGVTSRHCSPSRASPAGQAIGDRYPRDDTESPTLTRCRLTGIKAWHTSLLISTFLTFTQITFPTKIHHIKTKTMAPVIKSEPVEEPMSRTEEYRKIVSFVTYNK